MGVDQVSGLIRSVIATPANVNDTTPADALIRGDEKAVLAANAENFRTHARERGVEGARRRGARLMRRPGKHHPRLPPRLAKLNGLIARRRAAVETTFATLKRRMGWAAIRYPGSGKRPLAQITLFRHGVQPAQMEEAVLVA